MDDAARAYDQRDEIVGLRGDANKQLAGGYCLRSAVLIALLFLLAPCGTAVLWIPDPLMCSPISTASSAGRFLASSPAASL